MSQEPRAPRPGDAVHFIDFGDPRCQKATVTKIYPGTEGNVVDLRSTEDPSYVLMVVEQDEGRGPGYWHWPCGQE